MRTSSCTEPSVAIASCLVMSSGNLGKRPILPVKTPLTEQSLARNTELASPFRGSRFEQWLGKRVTHDTNPGLKSLSHFWAEHHGGRVLNRSQPDTHASVDVPSIAPRAQSSFAVMSAAPAAAVAESATTSPLLKTKAESVVEDIFGVLRQLSRSPDTDKDSLSTLLVGLSRFIKETEERMAPSKPGIHTVSKELGLCLGHLNAGEAKRLLMKLEGKLGNSARTVTHFACHEVKIKAKAATPTLIRLNQCEQLLKGLMTGLRSGIHDCGPRSSPQASTAKTFNELSPLERNAYSQTLSVH